jgi:putative sterol carrier protein
MVTVQDSFDYMAKAFNKQKALEMKRKVVLQYNIAGIGGGSWQLILENGAYTITPGNAIQPVSCTMNYDSVDSFYGMTTGEIGGLKGYMTGKLKFSGPRALLEEMGKIFPGKR